jgi:hypothetical protein
MTTVASGPEAALSQENVQAFAEAWYRLLDVHAPEAEVVPLVHPDAEMVFPEATLHGLDAFKGWYSTVTHRFFDEVHVVKLVETGVAVGDRASVKVVVNWQARIWDPPAARSTWLGFDAYQTWEVAATADGRLQITRYVVDSLDPMPGSASL